MTRDEFEEALFTKLCTHDHVDALLFLTILVMFSCIPLKTKLMILLKACTFSSSSSKEEDKDISVSVVQVELVAASIYRVVNEHDRGVMSLQQTQRVGVEMIVRDLRNRNTRLIRKIDERHSHLTTLSTHTHTRDVCLGLCLGL